MTTSGSYFLSKFGWQERWMFDYNKIILLDRPQEFVNNDYLEISKVSKNYTESKDAVLNRMNTNALIQTLLMVVFLFLNTHFLSVIMIQKIWCILNTKVN